MRFCNIVIPRFAKHRRKQFDIHLIAVFYITFQIFDFLKFTLVL